MAGTLFQYCREEKQVDCLKKKTDRHASLSICVTFDNFQLSGKSPVYNEQLKRRQKGSYIVHGAHDCLFHLDLQLYQQGRTSRLFELLLG